MRYIPTLRTPVIGSRVMTPGDVMQRPATSVICLSTDTGCVPRASSPRALSAPRKSRRLSSAMMHGADPAGQELVADLQEPGALEPAREAVRVGKVEHRL